MNERVLGVCSWSLRCAAPEPLAAFVKDAGIGAVQLALEPLRTGAWDEEKTRGALEDAGIRIVSGMMAMAGEDYSSIASIARTGGVRPDQTWPANKAAAREIAPIAKRLGIPLVTFHAGFLPHGSDDPVRAGMVDRLRILADIFASHDVAIAFETGQESATTLLEVLEEIDREGVGANFDPANMILYASGDPIEALRTLAPRVVQIHAKDATASETSGRWGREMPTGCGAVDWNALFEVVESQGIAVDIIIERELGEDRARDIRTAAEFLLPYIASAGSSLP